MTTLLKSVSHPSTSDPFPSRFGSVKTFIATNRDNPFLNEVLGESARARLSELLDIDERIVTPESFDSLQEDLQECEFLLGTWGFPVCLAERMAKLPRLRAVLYAGGSVKAFARPFLERGIPVINGRAANASAVAEFCLAQIVLCNKGYFENTRMCRNPATARQTVAFTGPGNAGVKVALLGYGAIARHLRILLRPFDIAVLVADPTLSESVEEQDNIRLVGRDQAFAEATVVTNHLPDLPQLQRVIGLEQFGRMLPHATFINTGRGRQVDEDALAAVFSRRPDLTALLDVTHPEPPHPGSPLYSLPNVQISSHIAGVVGNERMRFIDVILADVARLRRGLPPLHSAKLKELDLMA
jgi:phosphoglycerate dehydrogenase-like enzyme